MIDTNIEDFEKDVRGYLDYAIKRTPHRNIFVKYGDIQFVIMSEEVLSNTLWAAIERGWEEGEKWNISK